MFWLVYSELGEAAESISSFSRSLGEVDCPPFTLFHFIRLFWNQTFTCETQKLHQTKDYDKLSILLHYEDFQSSLILSCCAYNWKQNFNCNFLWENIITFYLKVKKRITVQWKPVLAPPGALAQYWQLLQLHEPDSNISFWFSGFLAKFTTFSAKRLTSNPQKSPTAVHKISWLALALEAETFFWSKAISSGSRSYPNVRRGYRIYTTGQKSPQPGSQQPPQDVLLADVHCEWSSCESPQSGKMKMNSYFNCPERKPCKRLKLCQEVTGNKMREQWRFQTHFIVIKFLK